MLCQAAALWWWLQTQAGHWGLLVSSTMRSQTREPVVPMPRVQAASPVLTLLPAPPQGPWAAAVPSVQVAATAPAALPTMAAAALSILHAPWCSQLGWEAPEPPGLTWLILKVGREREIKQLRKHRNETLRASRSCCKEGLVKNTFSCITHL